MRNLTKTLNRWKNTSKFRVIFIEERENANIYLLTLTRNGTVRTLELSDLELTVGYGKSWRYLLKDTLLELRYRTVSGQTSEM